MACALDRPMQNFRTSTAATAAAALLLKNISRLDFGAQNDY